MRSFNPRTPCGVRHFRSFRFYLSRCFNPRTPCGVRLDVLEDIIKKKPFQSTHSLRSATCNDCKFFYQKPVSIHALLAECDQCLRRRARNDSGFNPRTPCGVRPGGVTISQHLSAFQSTHSLRSATSACGRGRQLRPVSIHALLAECDIHQKFGLRRRLCFNPRTPCGVRPGAELSLSGLCPRFNPRTPCGVRQAAGNMAETFL